MALLIEDYALIGDTHGAALVGRNGSIDWWCAPRYDSAACFAALLGDRNNGHWSISPVGAPLSSRRRYIPDTLVLETEWDVAGGTVRVIDHMPLREECCRVVRIIEGVSGTVDMEVELIIRFDYGHIVPWVRKIADGSLSAIGGPDSLNVRTPIRLRGEGLTSRANAQYPEPHTLPFGWVGGGGWDLVGRELLLRDGDPDS